MKLNPRICIDMRKRLDNQLKSWANMRLWSYKPRKGWLKSIRESLGMSSRQMAKHLGKSNADVLAMEKREAQNRITLETLEIAAESLGCRLVYALVPSTTLEEMVNSNANKAAQRIVQKTSHNMGLENQNITKDEVQAQIEDLAFELKNKLDPRIWNTET